MTALSHALRLLPLGLAALASVATSPLPYSVYITEVTPFHGETGVAADVQPLVTLTVEEDAPDPTVAWLSLRHADGTLVAGHVEGVGLNSALVLLRFVPDAPLPADDYEIILDHGGAIDAYDADGHSVSYSVFAFTTVSRPEIRNYAFPGSGTQANIGFSQAVDLASLATHLSGLDATGDPLAVVDIAVVDARLHQYAITLPNGTVDVALADGLLAADGTPVPGLPLLFSDPAP